MKKVWLIVSEDEYCPENNNGFPPVCGVVSSKKLANEAVKKMNKIEKESKWGWKRYFALEYKVDIIKE